MHNITKAGFFLLLSAFGLLPLAAIAEAGAGTGTFVPLGEGAEIVDVRVVNQDSDTIIIDYQLGGFDLAPVIIDSETYYSVRLGKESCMLETGLPELPDVSRSVIVPDNAEMGVRVLTATFQEFEGINVVPSKGNLPRTIDPASVPFEFGSAYAMDEWYPAELATHRDPYILRDFRGMVVTVNPFQYNPVQHILRVYDHIVVEIVRVGPGQINVIDRAGPPEAVNAEFGKLYASHFINRDFFRYTPISEVGEMLVIAYDDFVPNMQPFVDWKNQMGIKTTLVAKSDVGTTAPAFQSYISDYYNATDLAFVFLIGDAAQIPSPYNDNAPADPVYALVDGGDNYPDIFIGRLSAENPSQVDVQVQKFVEYEKTPAEGGHWYHKGTGIGSAEGAGIGDDGEADWEHIENIRTDLVNFTFTQVDSVYAPFGATAQMVTNAVNNGRSIINYCGHGSMSGWSTSGFNITHVNALVNDNMLPHIVSVACVNGKFHTGTCFAESWLRATHGNEPTGAVGMYASTVNMSWAPPMAAQDETVDLLVAEEKRTYGALCFSGSCQMMDEYGGGGIDEFKNWHVFGDPSLRVRTDTPALLTVEHDESIDPEAVTFTVTVPGIEGALCGLSNDGEFHGSAFTDASGVAEIVIAGQLPDDEVALTVSYFNCHPYIVSITVGELLIPALLVEPDTLTVYMPLEEIHTEYIYISNVGMEGSLLEFILSVFSFSADPWMDANPREGQVQYGETQDVEVVFDTHGLSNGIYEGKILVDSNGGSALVFVTLYAGEYAGVADRNAPSVLALAPASPNPFGGSTAICFQLPEPGSAQLGVYDMSGRLVRTLISGTLDAGVHHLAWDGRDASGREMPGGVYLYRLEAGRRSLSGKVMALR